MEMSLYYNVGQINSREREREKNIGIVVFEGGSVGVAVGVYKYVRSRFFSLSFNLFSTWERKIKET